MKLNDVDTFLPELHDNEMAGKLSNKGCKDASETSLTFNLLFINTKLLGSLF